VHTVTSLLGDLRRLGIGSGDSLLVHSSMKALGVVAGGPDAVLDALSQLVPNGLLLLPTHTWKEHNNPGGIFDPRTEPSCVGLLSERFRHREGVWRSWHPTHSLAGLGRTAPDFLAGEELTRTPCPRTGCWGRLYDIGARILFLGAPSRTNTFLHSVEEWHGVPDRIATQPTLFRIRRPDAAETLIDCPQYRHHSSFGDVSQNYGKLAAELLARGIARTGCVGDAACLLIEVRPLADLVGQHLKQDPHFFESA
jgi:aminoglycoside 3-N-acetyltransferase